MTDALFLGVLIGVAATITPAVYLAVRVALAELPDPKPPAPAPIDVHPEFAAAADDVIARAEAYERENERELELRRLERASHALQPFGLYMCAGKRGDQ